MVTSTDIEEKQNEISKEVLSKFPQTTVCKWLSNLFLKKCLCDNLFPVLRWKNHDIFISRPNIQPNIQDDPWK